MLEIQKQRTNIGVGIGLVLQIAGRVLMASDGSSAAFPLGALVLVAGLAFFAWGCSMYAEAKGYHPAVGLVGLLSLIGLLILVSLHDRNPEQEAAPPAA